MGSSLFEVALGLALGMLGYENNMTTRGAEPRCGSHVLAPPLPAARSVALAARAKVNNNQLDYGTEALDACHGNAVVAADYAYGSLGDGNAVRVVVTAVAFAGFVSACGPQPFIVARGRDSRPDLATCGQGDLFEVDQARNCLVFWGTVYTCAPGLSHSVSDCQVDPNGEVRWVGYSYGPNEWERIGWSACDRATHDRVVALSFCPAP